jgi:hypothetical protein
MGAHSVGQGGLNRSANDVAPDYGGDGLSSIPLNKFQCYFSRRKVCPRDHRGDGVEDVLLGFLLHIRWHLPICRFTHIGAELTCDICWASVIFSRIGHLRPGRPAWEYRRSGNCARSLQHRAPGKCVFPFVHDPILYMRKTGCPRSQAARESRSLHQPWKSDVRLGICAAISLRMFSAMRTASAESLTELNGISITSMPTGWSDASSIFSFIS